MTYAHDMTTTPTPTRTTTSGVGLPSALRFSVMRLARRLRQERRESSLTLTQLATLATLERTGPLTPGELAAHERVQRPSMTRCLTSLQSAGLVDRVPHPVDGRQVLVSVTEDARAMLREDRARREMWLAQRVRELTPDERERLRAALPVLEKLAAG